MNSIFRPLLNFAVCLTATAASAQTISGYTTLDIDQTSNIVTATCETDLDADTDSFYEASVSCIVRDGNGNVVAAGNNTDNNSGLGYAQVVLTFNGISGAYYTATGTHSAYITLTYDLADTRPGQNFNQYDDVLNFSQFAQGSAPPQIYNGSYIWRADGPDTPARNIYVKLGNTMDSNIAYYTQGQLDNIISNAQALFSQHCDAKFATVIPSYSNAGFFASLHATNFIQYPPGALNIPAHNGADADTQVNTPGRPIDLYPNSYPTTVGFPVGFLEFIFIHEGVHHFTGWLDFNSPTGDDFVTRFASSGYTNTSGATNDFTVWLTNGCLP